MTRRFVAVLSVIVCICAAVLLAQSPPLSLDGVIRDSSGASIPGAKVQLYNIAEKVVATTQSDQQGRYRIYGIAAGHYELRVGAAGFIPIALKVTLSGNKTVSMDVALQIGEVAESLEALSNSRGGRGIGAGNGGGVIPDRSWQATAIQGGIASGAPGGSMAGALGGTVGPVPSPPPPSMKPRPATPQRMRIAPVEERENYSYFVENGFQSPLTAPLSTFSIDVDTASYANMRRFLREGKRPPKDAIRLEEWVNYFQYRYPEPRGEHPVSITTEMATCPWQPQHKLARIGLKAKSLDVAKLPPANWVFLLDVSGSMATPEKLPLLQRAFSLLTEQLQSQDEVSIVVYASSAGIALPPTSGREREKILNAVSSLRASGPTAGAQGIQLAYKIARANFKKGGNNRVILATDGDFNVGVSTEAELIRLIEEQREDGIFLTVLGFGTDNLQDAKMKVLSKHGNGNYAYVDSLLEARKVLVQEMGANLLTLAKDVKLQVEFNPAKVQAYRLIGYENRLLRPEDFNDDKKDAGEMGTGHTVTALYEMFPLT